MKDPPCARSRTSIALTMYAALRIYDVRFIGRRLKTRVCESRSFLIALLSSIHGSLILPLAIAIVNCYIVLPSYHRNSSQGFVLPAFGPMHPLRVANQGTTKLVNCSQLLFFWNKCCFNAFVLTDQRIFESIAGNFMLCSFHSFLYGPGDRR